LKKIENQISPIASKKIDFKMKENNEINQKKRNSKSTKQQQSNSNTNSGKILQAEKKESRSDLPSQFLSQYNMNSVDISQFQDFVLSSQNNNSLRFDVNNINLDDEKEKDFSQNQNEIQNNNDIQTYKKKILNNYNKYRLSNQKNEKKK